MGIIDVTATAFNKMPYFGIINVSTTTAITENQNNNLFAVYPVPASNTLNVSFMLDQSEKVKVALYNNIGQEMMSIANEEVAGGAFNKSVDITTLPAGIYFCKMESDHNITTKYVIIQK